MYNILSLSIRRTGQHAVIDWIGHQTKNTTFFYNACRIDKKNKKFIPFKGKVVTYSLDKISTLNFNNIYGLEVFDLDNFKKLKLYEYDIDQIILINRDIYNFLASNHAKIKKFDSRFYKPFKQPYKGVSSTFLDQWAKLIKQSLRLKDYFCDFPFLDVSYNLWFMDKSYRNYISRYLNINIGDKGKSSMNNLKYSSFDGKIHDANYLRVLSRYEDYMNNEEFLNFFRHNPELEYLNKEYFGFDLKLRYR